MKKIILAVTMMIAVASGAFAKEGIEVSKKVLSAFEKDFTTAKNVVWKKEGEYLKARFVMSDMVTDAYYNEEGELLGSARSLKFSQLPLAVIHEFNNRFSESSVFDVTEITNTEGTSYRIWLSKKDRRIRLRATPLGEISVVEKCKK